MAIIINAEGLVLGRMASKVAKTLLSGEKVEIVNAEKAIMSGSKPFILEKVRVKLARAPKSNPTKGPHISRMPDRIVRSSVRNMLPKYSTRGRKALGNLRVWVGVPAALKNEKAETIENAKKGTFKKSMTIGEISKISGAKF